MEDSDFNPMVDSVDEKGTDWCYACIACILCDVFSGDDSTKGVSLSVVGSISAVA